jgi:hypothetical protein
MSRLRIHIGISLIAVLTACGPSQQEPVMLSPPGDQERLETYLSKSQLQEAVWEAIKLERYERADSIRAILGSILLSEPVEIEGWKGKGVMQSYLLTFDHGILGFFKVAGSDTSGPIRNEIAAYEVDNLLRIHLTPMTLARSLTFPDGKTVEGVIKYFVESSRTAEDLGLKSVMKPDLLLFFDTVIGNADRHLGNWMIRDDTKELFAIDHNRTFRFDLDWYHRMRSIGDPASLRKVFERYQSLSPAEFRKVLTPYLSRAEIDQFLEKRSIIVRYLNNIISDSAMRNSVRLSRAA